MKPTTAVFFAILACGSHAAQVPAPDDAREEQRESEKLAEWPAPADAKELEKDVARLRKAHTAEMGEQASSALVALGAAAAPPLLAALGKEKDDGARTRILDVLTKVTGTEHTRLLGAEFASRALEVRVFSMRRAAIFRDAGLAEVARTAWLAVEKQGDKADPLERYAAALCLSSTGAPEVLEHLLGAADKHWSERGAELRAATEALRGNAAAIAVLEPHLAAGAERRAKVAALRLFAGIGDRPAAQRLLKPLLAGSDNSILVEAINACRGIVDGAPPIEKLAVFEAVEMAKEWERKL